MTYATAPDLGSLTWVKGEIDAALERAREILDQGSADGTPSGLQFARTHVHQVRGALAIVGLDGLTQFADTLEQLLGEMAREAIPADAPTRALVRRALAVIGNYLEELAHGAPDQPLRLAEPYLALAAARGQADASPVDLFTPDLSRRPPARAADAEPATPEAAALILRSARSRFERGLLEWLRKGTAGDGARAMREAIAEIEAQQHNPAARSLWWASLAFYDALIDGSLQPEPAIKRLCTQIDAQFRRLLAGTPAAPDRLLRELLYRIAHCPVTTEQQRAVRACWELDALLPEAGAAVSGTPSAPLLDTLHRQLANAREQWDDFCTGTAVALARFEDAIAAMEAPLAPLGRPATQALVAGVLDFTRWLRRDPLLFADAAAMEVATALLLLEAGLERRPPASGFGARVEAVQQRLQALQRGETPAAEADAAALAGAAAAQDKALLEQLSKEMLASLAQVEQALDDFFRNPARREALQRLHQPLQQISGALSVLGEGEALALVRDAAARIAALGDEDSAAGQAEFEALAHQLSALGFHLEALPRGGSALQDLLDSRPQAPLPTPAPTPQGAQAEAESLVEPAVAEPIAVEAAVAAPAAAPESALPAVEDAVATEPVATADSAAEADTAAATESAAEALALAADADEDETAITLIEDLEDLEDLENLEELESPGAVLESAAPPAPSVAAPVTAAATIAEPEVDAELLAIFLEEAGEVLASLRDRLQGLRAAPAATDELVTIRRGFHTLKGSGRMVGLAQLGDTAWAVEQTLNRWLQLDWPVTPALLAFIDAGEQLFSTWIERLRGAQAEPVDTARLVAEAERLCAADTPAFEAPAAPQATEVPSAAPSALAASEDADWSYEAMLDETWNLADADAADELVLLEMPASEEPAFNMPAAADAAATAPAPAEIDAWPEVPELPAITAFGLADEDIGFAIDDEFDLPAAPTADTVPAAATTAAAGAHEPAPPVATEAPAIEEAPEVLRIGDIELSRALYELFCAEAAQHLDTLDAELHALRSAAPRPPSSAALRATHTLAGIAGTAHISAMHQLGRALENALERLIDATSAAHANDLALLADAAHTLRAMLVQVLEARLPKSSPELVAALDAAPRSAPAPQPEAATAPVMPPSPPLPAAPATPRRPAVAEPIPADDIDHALLPIFLEEAAETTGELHATLRRWRDLPGSAEPARGIARLLHSLKGSARMAGAMGLGALLHQLESRLEDGVSAQEAPAALVDELTLGLDRCEQLIDALALGEPAAPAAAAIEIAGEVPAAAASSEAERSEEAEALSSPTLRVRAELVDRFVNQAGEIGVARSRINGELRTLRRSLLDLTENVIRLRSQLREVEIQAEVQMQSRIALAGGHQADFDPLELDRYTRLQELTRMMAESVNDVTTVQQNLLQNLDGADLALNSQARMARELQQGLMQVRMLPFDSLASRLYRVVRQSARELGKRATLDLRGGRIEIDRSVLEQMAAPLEHLLRNAVAHGIEAPAERAAAGKPESGSIVLTVSQEGNEIAIEIADDGAGLDLDRIAARARERGLIGAHEQPDERRLTNLIFVSGFSTASELSAVSGRGVGMDVVKAQTAAAGGRVDVSTRHGAGTRFHLRLPLTLAVTQALLVESGGRTWAVPSNMIVQALELKPDALGKLQDEHGLDWQGERFPYRYLPRLLGDREARPVEQRYNWVLLLRAGAQTLALHVDGLRGNQEIIVKNAGPQLTRIVGMSGATVLGDGEIVLILNPVALASRSLAQEDAGELGDTPASEAPAPLHLPTVMVVDDSLTVRKITGRLLEREGYRVLTAKDGVDALEQLIDTVPDVVLSDIEMPRMDGFDLVRNIRADARLKHLPVIMITSRLAEKHRRYAEEVGASHYLGKPYQEEALLALVAGYTRAKARAVADLVATA